LLRLLCSPPEATPQGGRPIELLLSLIPFQIANAMLVGFDGM